MTLFSVILKIIPLICLFPDNFFHSVFLSLSLCCLLFVFMVRKVSIPRTTSSECGANLVETTSSNGCNSEYSLKLNDWTPKGKSGRKFLLIKILFIFQK